MVCGHPLPAGLREADRLPEPIFTPSTKAEVGHDENITRAQLAELVGDEMARQLEERSIALYAEGARRAEEVGLILADTKFEFGKIDGELAVIDEVLTPDSSRFWDRGRYEPGSSPPSFDKQFVRDFVAGSGWNKEPPAPQLPDEVIRGTRDRYVAAYERLTGRAWG
jgi:phosphoribosylaminoimidazole-succinocarboxamide synthase